MLDTHTDLLAQMNKRLGILGLGSHAISDVLEKSKCLIYYIYVDIRVFNPYAHSNCSPPLNLGTNKRLCYETRILEVEHRLFTPLVLFSAAGGMGTDAATITYKRLASLLAEKHAQLYLKTMNWIRCNLSFSWVRSSITCIRGS